MTINQRITYAAVQTGQIARCPFSSLYRDSNADKKSANWRRFSVAPTKSPHAPDWKPPARCDFCALTARKFRGLQRNSLLNDTGNFCAGTGNLHARTGTLNEL